MLAVVTVFLFMEAAQAIHHITRTHRHHRHKESAELHQKGGKDVTQPEEIDPYIKFLHALASDYSEEGIMADPTGPLQNIQTFKTSKSAHEHKRRPRRNKHGRKRHGQRSVIVKLLPTEDLKSLKEFPSLSQPHASNTIAVITDRDMKKKISRREWKLADKVANDKMEKEVSLLVNYLKL